MCSESTGTIFSTLSLKIKKHKKTKAAWIAMRPKWRPQCVEWKNWIHNGNTKKMEGKNTTMAHLCPNMIYDLAGELHVMIERVDQGFVRSRNIAARPRIDSDADRLLHTSTLCILPLYPAAMSFSPPLHHSRNHRAALDAVRREFIPLKVYLLLLSLNLKGWKRKLSTFCKHPGKGKENFPPQPQRHISILLCQISGRTQQESI